MAHKMGCRKVVRTAVAASVIGAAGQFALAGCFLYRTMARHGKSFDRVWKLSGTDWAIYAKQIATGREWLLSKPHEEVEVTSYDGARLHGRFFSCGVSGRVAICFHGYTSSGLIDYAMLAKFYLEKGLDVLLVDDRAHGESEGEYVGFGCLDRMDVLRWVEYIKERFGDGCRIMLHGISMGGTMVLMASGLPLPGQVKLIVSDCAFTSAYEVLVSFLHRRYHMPAFPLMPVYDLLARMIAGYSVKGCNARDEVRKSRIPTLIIHGDQDSFVPFAMGRELYGACAAPKKFLSVKGGNHANNYLKDPVSYEAAVSDMMERFFAS